MRSSVIVKPSMESTSSGPSTQLHSTPCTSALSLKCWSVLKLHCRYNTFASGGSDGTVSLWDHTAKKRLKQYPKYNSAVTSMSFSSSGEKLAIGVSYAWDEGEDGAKKEAEAKGGKVVEVKIRKVSDEVKVRGCSKSTRVCFADPFFIVASGKAVDISSAIVELIRHPFHAGRLRSPETLHHNLHMVNSMQTKF